MPSPAASFMLGIVTATAIAGGFAATFMESVATQRATDTLLRAPAKPVVVAAPIIPVAQPSPATIAPRTSGLASPSPATEVTTRSPAPLPSPAAVPVSKPTDASADSATTQQAARPKPPAEIRKKTASKPVKRKREWHEEERPVADRGLGGGGLFGLFR